MYQTRVDLVIKSCHLPLEANITDLKDHLPYLEI